MVIQNFKRIKYLKFNLTETKIILNKDYFERQDLIEALKNLLANKKTNQESIIKWTEFDTIYDSTTTKVIVIPSIIDFQKDFLNGPKSLFKELIIEIMSILEMKNSNLIEIQNLLFNFKLENELPIFEELLKKINKDLELNTESYIAKNIGQIIADYYILDITKDGEKITTNNISLIDLKKIYLYFLDCFKKCSNENLLLIFDDPLNGLNYLEMLEMWNLINTFKNKIVIASWLPKIENENLPNLFLWNKNWFIDLSNVFNNLYEYQKFIDTPIEKIIDSTLQEFQKFFNIYDQNHQSFIKFQEKDSEIIWKVLINQI